MLTPGGNLGPYAIAEKIGSGGMGEVYRARDTKLNRDVALKVLPLEFAGDAERMARFNREAQVLASLNHPQIASIYGLEETNGVRALVMELVEGPTLADRIAKGPIPLDEVLPIARQVAEALEYAHERGIIHRDLKPANVKLTPDGTVKILDFGLAKALEGETTEKDSSTSPTLTIASTRAGVLIGTAAYMSPEQARGKRVDRRCDIWAFGCLLFEMLSGKPAFSGETVSDTLADVIKDDPDWSLVPALTPLGIRELLQRCLKKESRLRLQSIGDARVTIEEPLSGTLPETASTAIAPIPSPRRRRALPWALFAASALMAIIFAIAYFSRSEAMPRSLRLTIDPPRGAQFGTALALSPDGTRLVFVASSSDKQMLWMRPLDSLQAYSIPGTEGGDFPFWSPDGKSIGFFEGGKLKRLDLGNGLIQNLCITGDPRGAAWGSDDTIVFAPDINSTLMKIPATGGTPVAATVFDPSRQERSDRWPSFLPDGRHFVFLEEGHAQAPDALAVGSLDSTQTQVLFTMPKGSAAFYADHYLIYSNGGFLFAQPFDSEHLKITGDPVRLAENVSPVGILGPTSYLSASASRTGLLVYRNDVSTVSQFVVMDRSGKTLRTIGPPASYAEPALSPDQKKIALAASDPQQAGTFTPLWLMDVATGTANRFTFDNFDSGSPIWSPDGRWIYFDSNRGGVYNIYRKLADGSADVELVRKSDNIESPSDISRDNRYLILEDFSPSTNRDLLYLPIQPGGQLKPFRATPASEADGRFSPDGHWVAYCSDENRAGDFEVFVSSFPPGGGKWQVSSGGGYWPMWSTDGRELYFISGTTLMAAEVVPGATFQFRPPYALFHVRPAQSVYDQAHSGYFVFPGGKKFLVNQLAGTTESPPISVVANWLSELKRK